MTDQGVYVNTDVAIRQIRQQGYRVIHSTVRAFARSHLQIPTPVRPVRGLHLSRNRSSTCAPSDGSASNSSISTRTTSVLGTRLPTLRLRWVAQRASSSLRSAERSTVNRSVDCCCTGEDSSREVSTGGGGAGTDGLSERPSRAATSDALPV